MPSFIEFGSVFAKVDTKDKDLRGAKKFRVQYLGSRREGSDKILHVTRTGIGQCLCQISSNSVQWLHHKFGAKTFGPPVCLKREKISFCHSNIIAKEPVTPVHHPITPFNSL